MLVFIVDLTWALRRRFFSPWRAFFIADLFFLNNPSRSVLLFLPCLQPGCQLSFSPVLQPTPEALDEGMLHERGDQLTVPVEHRFLVDEVHDAVLEGKAEEAIDMGV
jgi:hypothetical protein